MFKRIFVGLVFCLCISVTASASFIGPVIDVGIHNLPENSSGIIEIFVSDPVGEAYPAVTGLNLHGQIGENQTGDLTPIFSSFDFTGGIWDAFPITVTGGPIDDPAAPRSERYAQTSVDFDFTGQEVLTSGLLLRMTIDTTGISAGQSFALKLAGTDLGQDTDYRSGSGDPVNPLIFNGWINITPEPATMTLLVMGGVMVVVRRRRRKIS